MAKRIDWKHIRRCLNGFFEVAPGAVYEILFVKEFKDKNTLGETRFDPNQIVIKEGLSDRMTCLVAGHEMYHAISEEYDLALTEKQVLGLEKSLTWQLKPGNIFINYEQTNKKSRSYRKRLQKSRSKAR